MIVYVSIGNSDDKLSQKEWAEFVTTIRYAIRRSNVAVIHGEWFSLPSAPFQNACWCVELSSDIHFRAKIKKIGKDFRQDSIAYAVAETEQLSWALGHE